MQLGKSQGGDHTGHHWFFQGSASDFSSASCRLVLWWVQALIPNVKGSEINRKQQRAAQQVLRAKEASVKAGLAALRSKSRAAKTKEAEQHMKRLGLK